MARHAGALYVNNTIIEQVNASFHQLTHVSYVWLLIQLISYTIN